MNTLTGKTAVVVVACAVVAGVAVVYAPALLAVAAVAAAWVFAPTSARLTIVLVVVFLPFTIGDVGPVPNLRIAEVLVPVAALTGFAACVKAHRRLLPPEAMPYVVALSVYVAVAVGHVVLRAGGVASLGGIGGAGVGLRAYYDLLLGPGVFLAVAWLGFTSKLHALGVRMLRVLVWVAAAAATLRVAGYFIGFDTPFLGETFRYGTVSRLAAGGFADRIGGLAEAAGLGLAGVAGLWFARDRGRWLIVPGVVLSAAVVLSGGRTLALGIIAAAGIVSVALSPAARSRAAVLGAVVAVAGTLGVALAGFARQFDRLLAFGGGLALQDPSRYTAIAFQLQEFARRPLFGKGIGVSTVPVSDPFVAVQVSRGGHSTYSSVLANQGLAGLMALAVVAGGPVVRSFREVHGLSRRDALPTGVHAVMMFVLFYGTTKLMQFVAGGNGYSDLTPYAYAGLLVAGLVWLREGAE